MVRNNFVDILNSWLSYCNYDPNKTSFNLCDISYDIHKENEYLITITNEYDQSGLLAIMFAKQMMEHLFKNSEVTVWDILHGTTCEKERELLEMFNSSDVVEAEKTFIHTFNNIYISCLGSKVLGDVDYKDVLDFVSKGIRNVMTGLHKLRLDVFSIGHSPIANISNFSTHIFVFNTLRDCLLCIEQSSVVDGIYLVYISDNNSAGGYFNYFIKSCGNIISVNERVNESFAGQHKRCRNTRWAEDKQFQLFPYNKIFEFTDHDYKGYATKHIIDQTKLDLKDLGEEMCTTILLSMFLLSLKYVGQSFDQDQQTYVNSMLPININTLKLTNSVDKNEIAVYNNSSIIKKHNDIGVNFNISDVLSGVYDKEFDSANKNRNYRETGYFKGYNQRLVDKFGKGFVFDVHELYKTDFSKMLTDSSLKQQMIDSEYVLNSEFVGSKKRIELEGYYNIRKQLAYYIRKQQEELLEQFGGVKKFGEWYNSKLHSNIEYVYKLCAKTVLSGEYKLFDQMINSTGDCAQRKWVTYYNNVKYPTGTYILRCLNDVDYNKNVVCPITGSYQTKHWFAFEPFQYTQIQRLCNCDLPDFMYEWKADDCYPYSGNNILDAVDYVGRLQTPINRYNIDKTNNTYCSLNFLIAFSKRGLDKIIKQYGE